MADDGNTLGFTLWPANDNAGQEAWFTEEKNSDWKLWSDVRAKDIGAWALLDATILQVLDIKAKDFREWRDQAYESLLAEEPLSTTKRIQPEQAESVATKLIELIQGSDDKPWSNNKTTWTKGCFLVYGPRMASLWKKSISKGRFKSAEDTPSKDMNSDPRLSSTPTPRSKQKARPRIPLSFTKPMTAKTPSAGSPDTSTAMSNSPNKRMRTNESVDSAPAGDRRMAELDEITDAMRKIRPTTFLVQRNIIVHLIGPKFSESESIAVGIGALVIEECAFAKPEDIRPEHLGWRIFCEILRDMDSNCFIQNGGLRDPDDPLVLLDPIDQLVLEYESPSERGRIGIIDNEIQWQRAIGILEFYVEVDGRDRDIHFVARG